MPTKSFYTEMIFIGLWYVQVEKYLTEDIVHVDGHALS
jgi:hypothetical protein